MIGIKLFVTLIFVSIAVASSLDGFCSFVETYTASLITIETVKVRVPFTKKCGIFLTRTCYEYRDRINYEHVPGNVQRTRTTQRCCEGYKPENSKCLPICSDPCSNGLCTEPGICSCSAGYHKNDQDICVAIECDPTIPENAECGNGTCTAKGICVCSEGFEKSNSNVGPSVASKCIPKCSNGCFNGNCISPETCTCNPGYQALNSSLCIPICQNACIYGTCTEPDKCACFDGYQIRNGTDHICDPVCTAGCINGMCEKPGKCLCDEGFQFAEESKICEPVCDKECVNSNCTAPNICTCEPGFSSLNSTHCDILCENCIHGFCDRPNECQCDFGYHMNIPDRICVQDECTNSLMENNCENGYCSNGICVCDSGFEKSGTNCCSPMCSLECINGFCSEPEVCQCHSGYEFIATNVIDGDEGNYTNCTSITQWNVCICENDYCEHGGVSDALTLTISLSGVVLIIILILAGGLAYRKYVIWKSYTCAVADVVYKKSMDGISL